MKGVGWPSMAVVYLAMTLDIAGFAMLLPVMPLITEEYGIDALQLSIMFSLYSLMQMIGGLAFGLLSDRFGRKPVMCACMGGSVVAYWAFAFSKSFSSLAVWRSFSGLFAGTQGIIQAYITDVTEEAGGERTRHLGYVSAAIGVGFSFAPAAGSYLSRFGVAAVSHGAAVLSLINFVLAVAFLREPPVDPSKSLSDDRGLGAGALASTAWSACSRRVCIVNLLYFMNFAALAGFESVFALYMQESYGFSQGQIGVAFITFGVVATAANATLQEYFVTWLGKRGAVALGHGSRCMALVVIVSGAFRSWSPLVFSAVWGVFGMLCGQPVVGMLGSAVPGEIRGLMMGVITSVGTAARFVAPIVAGRLYESNPSYPWYFSMAVSALALPLTAWAPEESQDVHVNAAGLSDKLCDPSAGLSMELHPMASELQGQLHGFEDGSPCRGYGSFESSYASYESFERCMEYSPYRGTTLSAIDAFS